MSFKEKWLEASKKKNSILCAGLDLAEKETIQNRLQYCLDFVEKVAPFSAAVKPNRNYIKDFSREQTRELVSCIHSFGMVAIDDAKIADIGDTNAAGLKHAAAEGYDAVTFAPFGGNIKQTVEFAKKENIGLITLVLMSNPEYEVIKNAQINGAPAYRYFAQQVADSGGESIVIGAPSPSNHITEAEILDVKNIIGEPLVLTPGVGKQGGSADFLAKTFGRNLMVNVGRTILNAEYPEQEAQKYQVLFNEPLK